MILCDLTQWYFLLSYHHSVIVSHCRVLQMPFKKQHCCDPFSPSERSRGQLNFNKIWSHCFYLLWLISTIWQSGQCFPFHYRSSLVLRSPLFFALVQFFFIQGVSNLFSNFWHLPNPQNIIKLRIWTKNLSITYTGCHSWAAQPSDNTSLQNFLLTHVAKVMPN